MSDERKGLYEKYKLQKADGTPVSGDYFVLRPSRDPHAAVALRAYAKSITDENPELAQDLFRWLLMVEATIEQHHADGPANETFPP